VKAIRSFSVCLVFAIVFQIKAEASIVIEEAESKVPVEAISQNDYQRKPVTESLKQQEYKQFTSYLNVPDLHAYFPNSILVQPSFKRYLVYCIFLC
jgi:hypothetical protein